MPSRVLLVEDVEELRATVRQALTLHGGFEVVADVGDGASAIAAAALYEPDVVVLDLGLPDLAGAELVTQVRAAAPHSKIVVYTAAAVTEGSTVATTADAVIPKDKGVRYLVRLLADLGANATFSVELRLGPSMDDVRVARRFVEEQCAQWGCVSALPEIRLVLSELVTNALLHAGATCVLRTRYADGILRMEIRDDGEGTPDLRNADAESEGGRGLMIVSALSQAWGVEAHKDGGKLVWAELEVA